VQPEALRLLHDRVHSLIVLVLVLVNTILGLSIRTVAAAVSAVGVGCAPHVPCARYCRLDRRSKAAQILPIDLRFILALGALCCIHALVAARRSG